MRSVRSEQRRQRWGIGGIYDQIETERIAQDQKHGGPAHDDSHSPEDWLSFVNCHVQRALCGTPQEYRHELVKVAALAVAALESFDRKAAPVMTDTTIGGRP